MQANAPEGPNNKPQQLTNNDQHDDAPDWSPNGKKLAFERYEADVDAFRIYTMTKQGAKEQPLTPAGQNALGSSWSPDGKRLAFWAGNDDKSDVYRINADGSQATNLTEGFGLRNSAPTWQPR